LSIGKLVERLKISWHFRFNDMSETWNTESKNVNKYSKNKK